LTEQKRIVERLASIGLPQWSQLVSRLSARSSDLALTNAAIRAARLGALARDSQRPEQ
jgi:hypothetical protein